MNDLLNPHMWDLWEPVTQPDAQLWQGYEDWLDQLEPELAQDRAEQAHVPGDELPF